MTSTSGTSEMSNNNCYYCISVMNRERCDGGGVFEKSAFNGRETSFCFLFNKKKFFKFFFFSSSFHSEKNMRMAASEWRGNLFLVVAFNTFFFCLIGNLQGDWRPSTRISRAASDHQAGGTSNHQNLHHSPSSCPPFHLHHPPYRDCESSAHYQSSQRRYPRNSRRTPINRQSKTDKTTTAYPKTLAHSFIYLFIKK